MSEQQGNRTSPGVRSKDNLRALRIYTVIQPLFTRACSKVKPSEAEGFVNSNFDNMIYFHIFPGIFLSQLIK